MSDQFSYSEVQLGPSESAARADNTAHQLQVLSPIVFAPSKGPEN